MLAANGRAPTSPARLNPGWPVPRGEAGAGLIVSRDHLRMNQVGSTPARVVSCCGNMVLPHGLEFAAFQMLENLREHGATIHCIVNDWENHRIVELAQQIGASWSEGPYAARINKRSLRPNEFLRTYRTVAATSNDLVQRATEIAATHVHIPDFAIVLRTFPALMRLPARGVKVVFQVANAPATERFYPRLWRHGVAPFVDVFVPNSQFTKTELGRIGVPAAKIAEPIHPVGRHALPRASADGKRDFSRIVFVGQTIPQKGLHVLLEAMSILVARGYSPILDVVGQMDGWEHPNFRGYRQSLVDRANASDLANRVHFHGYLSDVPSVLDRAGIHCCPSLPELREGFGLVNIEAKRAGLPSVVFPSGALPELVAHRVDGWICTHATAESLAEGLQYFLEDSGRTERAGSCARNSAEAFSSARANKAWRIVFGM